MIHFEFSYLLLGLEIFEHPVNVDPGERGVEQIDRPEVADIGRHAGVSPG